MGCLKLHTVNKTDLKISWINKAVRLEKSNLKVRSSYLFSFNGKEKDDDINGEGNSYDFGARIYDPRLGRWMSVDPLQQKYADLSPYNFTGNNPIVFIDPSGKTIVIGKQDQSAFIKDMTKIYGKAAETMFTFDDKNQLMVSGGDALKGDQKTVYGAVLEVVKQNDVTRIIYTEGPVNNPESNKQEVDKDGNKVDVRDRGGEITMTKSDNPKVTENKIYILKSPEDGGMASQTILDTKREDGRVVVKGISSKITKVEPRVTDVVHGIGHVLNQKNNDQYKVIDLDNAGRRVAGIPERPYDKEHSSSDGTHEEGKFSPPNK